MPSARWTTGHFAYALWRSTQPLTPTPPTSSELRHVERAEWERLAAQVERDYYGTEDLVSVGVLSAAQLDWWLEVARGAREAREQAERAATHPTAEVTS